MSTFQSISPTTGEVVWEGKAASKEEVNAAVKRAREAFDSWSSLPLEKRIETLFAFRDLLRQAKDQLAEAISKETGKPLWESKGEVASMANKVDISIDAYHQRCRDLVKEMSTSLSITRHRPHGVVAVFGPFNFPGHLPNGHIVPALLSGNTVIFKPSEFTPYVGEMTLKLWEKAGIPPGVLNLVQGGRETGQLLAEHPSIDGLFFTGSWQTGRVLAEAFARHPEKILALEMGGNNPLVVYEVKDLPAAAFMTIQSAYLTAGQRCTCARRLIIVGTEGEDFLVELIRWIKGIRIGAYTEDPEPSFGPVIREAAVHRLLNAQQALEEKGGRPLAKMQALHPGTGFLSPGLMDVTNVPNRPDEELFGPFLQVIRVSSFEEAIGEANNTAFGLSAGLLSDNADNYPPFYRKIRAGVVNWNQPLTGASSSAPFGGIGHSGNHRPSAFYAADYCSYPVASMESTHLKMPEKFPPGITQ